MPNSDATLLAYQPIYDAALKTVGGELLYRSDEGVSALEVGESVATSAVLFNLCTGINKQFEGFEHPIYINVSSELLLSKEFLPLDPARVVIELVERIQPTAEIVDAVKRWHEQGFSFAFDDFEFSDAWEPLLKYCDIIKVDISQTSLSEVRTLKSKLSRWNIKWLAERVETQVEFELYKALGFDYFQGYFFCRPINISGHKMTPSVANLASLMNEIFDPEVDIQILGEKLSAEPGLSIKLLKVANSGFYRSSKPIETMQQALMRLGLDQVRKWVLLIGILDQTSPAATQLILTRAHTVTELTRRYFADRIDPDRAFLAALLSGSEILLNVEKETFIQSLEISNDIREASMYLKGTMGSVIEMVMQLENAQQKQSRGQEHRKPVGKKVIAAYQEQAVLVQRMLDSLC